MAYGYDDTSMPGGRTLTRDDLDKDFPDNPVMVGHTSLHGAVLNSAAFKKYGISAATKTPPGGIIVRKKGSNEPEGLVMETAWLPIFSSLPKPTLEQEVEWTTAGQTIYAAAGVTTAQEGATHAPDVALMRRAAAGNAHIIDVVATRSSPTSTVLTDFPAEHFGKYKNHLKLGRREGHARRLAPGPHGLLHHALPRRRAQRREELEGRAPLPPGHRQRVVQEGLRPEPAAPRARQRRRGPRRAPAAHECRGGQPRRPPHDRHPLPVRATGPARQVRRSTSSSRRSSPSTPSTSATRTCGSAARSRPTS